MNDQIRSAIAGLAFLFAGNALSFPTKPVSIVVAQTPGGANDVLVRLVAGKLQEAWGTPVLVEFRSGAGVIVGTQYVARSAPDGYTIGHITSAHATNPSMDVKLPYDSLRDFVPVARLGFNVLGLVVVPSLNVDDVKGLIELARSKPNFLSHGSNGIGTSAHLAGELLKSMAGVKMVHVPYKGGAPLYADMMGGRVQVAIAILGSAMPLVKTGKLKLLAVTSPDRSALFKEYPPISATLPGYDMTTWNGFVVPAGTPVDIVRKISADIIRAANAPELQPKMVEIGYEVATLNSAEFDAYIRAEIESKRKVVRESGAKFE